MRSLAAVGRPLRGRRIIQTLCELKPMKSARLLACARRQSRILVKLCDPTHLYEIGEGGSSQRTAVAPCIVVGFNRWLRGTSHCCGPPWLNGHTCRILRPSLVFPLWRLHCRFGGRKSLQPGPYNRTDEHRRVVLGVFVERVVNYCRRPLVLVMSETRGTTRTPHSWCLLAETLCE